MEIVLMGGFVLVGLVWMIQAVKNQTKWNELTFLLFALFSLFVLQSGFGDEVLGQQITWMASSYLALTWLSSQFIRSKWGILLPLVGTLIFFLFIGNSVDFNGYSLSFTKSNALLLPVFGAFVPFLVNFKSHWIHRLIGLEHPDSERVIGVFAVGMMLLTASIFGQTYGIILMGIGALGTHFFLKTGFQTHFRTVIALWLIPLATHILHQSQIELEAITQGAVLIGLFAGAAASVWIFSWTKQENPSIKAILWMIIVSFLAAMAFVFSEKIKEHTGGMSAWLAMLFAFSLTIPFLSKRGENLAGGYVSLLVAFGLFAAPLLKSPIADLPTNPKLAQKQPVGTKQKEASVLDVAGLDLSAHVGAWKIVPKSSKITFELGPEGTRTKGFFADFSGKTQIEKDFTKNGLEVNLVVKSLSTFNDYRDNSLMSSLYFDEAKHPAITFVSKSWEKQGYAYIVKGDFTMKGKTQDMTIEMKAAAAGNEKGKGYLILVGKSSVDRTKHGMESDPKIGDIVDFQFEVEFTR